MTRTKGCCVDNRYSLRISQRGWAAVLGSIVLIAVALIEPAAAELPRGSAERTLEVAIVSRGGADESDTRPSICTWQRAARHVAGLIAKVLLRTAHPPIHGL